MAALLTVRDVVRLAKASERTIRADIAAGHLAVIRMPDGSLRIPASNIAGYRFAGRRRRQRLSVAAAAAKAACSIRTIRRAIARGDLECERVSAGRIVVTSTSFADWLRARNPALLQPVSGPAWYSVATLARLSGRTPRQIYHDRSKGVFGGWRLGDVVRIRWDDARDYIKSNANG